jgi:hypothetical protein
MPKQPTYEELKDLLAAKDRELQALRGVPVSSVQGGERAVTAGRDIRDTVILTGDRNIGSVETLTIQSAIFLTPPDPGKPEPKVLLWNYLNRVLQETSKVDLSGIDKRAASDQEEARLELAAIYTGLDTILQDADTIDASSTVELQRSEHKVSALSFVSEKPAAAILGDPGSGKTTFANHLALCLAGEMLGLKHSNLAELGDDWKAGALVPVRVVLRHFAAQIGELEGATPADQLWQFIVSQLGSALSDFAPLLQKQLLTDGGLLILDGLDEVPEADRCREAIKQAIIGIGKQFPKLHILLTSRTYAYQKQQWRLPGFAEAVLAPFSAEQIEVFVDRWYGKEDVDRHCNMGDTGIGNTSAVGMFPTGQAVCGADDMAGNVWEWCLTKWVNTYKNYEKSEDNTPEDNESSRVLRGGAFGDYAYGVRCAVRGYYDPDPRSYGIGFRVVAPPF